MKKKTAALLSSCAAIAVCSSLIVGSTYALFTSEDKVNIAVTAGKVAVTAEVGELTATTTLDTTYEKTGKEEVGFQLGGSASVEGSSITLDKVMPGDTVSFPVTVTNNSNVSVLGRVSYKVKSGLLLASGLTVEVGEYDFTGKQEYATAWKSLDKTTTYNVTVSLPENSGNVYQELTTEISFAVEAIQANGAAAGEGAGGVDLPDFSAAKEAYEGDNLAVVEDATDLTAAMKEGGYVLLAKDIEVGSLKDGDKHFPAGTVIDGNGNKITDSTGNLSASKDVEYRNIVFDIDGSWHGVITNSAKFYNCTFDGTTPYITPTEGDIVFDGCTFIDTVLQICYNENSKLGPQDMNTTITNNTFIVNNTDVKTHAIVLGGGSVDYWANGGKTVTVSGNTFNSRYTTSYIAYYIYGDYNTTLTAVPLYLNNTYNGLAMYSINSTDVENQHEIKLDEGKHLIGNAVCDTDQEAIEALKAGGNVKLYADINVTDNGVDAESNGLLASSGVVLEAGKDLTIKGDGHTITLNHTAFNSFDALNLEGVMSGTIVFENVHFKSENPNGSYVLTLGSGSTATVKFINCTFEGMYTAVLCNNYAKGNAKVIIEGCTYIGTQWGYSLQSTGNVTVTFTGNKSEGTYLGDKETF